MIIKWTIASFAGKTEIFHEVNTWAPKKLYFDYGYKVLLPMREVIKRLFFIF